MNRDECLKNNVSTDQEFSWICWYGNGRDISKKESLNSSMSSMKVQKEEEKIVDHNSLQRGVRGGFNLIRAEFSGMIWLTWGWIWHPIPLGEAKNTFLMKTLHFPLTHGGFHVIFEPFHDHFELFHLYSSL